MIPEQLMRKAQRWSHEDEDMTNPAAQLDSIAAQLMEVQQQWSHPDRESRLAAALVASRDVWHGIQSALAEGKLVLPSEVQHNLLILSVYADSKISGCEATPAAEVLSQLIAMTRTLAGSIRERQEEA